MPLQQVHEDDDCLWIAGSDGAPVAISKRGLSDATLARIQRKAEEAADVAEPDADGDDVQRFADGGLVDDPNDPMWSAVGGAADVSPTGLEEPISAEAEQGIPVQPYDPRMEAVADLQSGSAFGNLAQGLAAQVDVPRWAQDVATAGQAGLGAAGRVIGEVADALPPASNLLNVPLVGTALAGGKLAAGVAPQILGGVVNPPPAPLGTQGTDGTQPVVGATPVALEESARLGARFSATSVYGGAPVRDPTVDTTTGDAAIAAQKEAAQKIAEIENTAAQDRAVREVAYADKLVSMQAAHVADVQKNRERVDELQKSVLGNPVDANRWWNGQTTGQRLANSIALLLGGFAGSSYASNYIDKAIDTDLRLQRDELAQKREDKENLLAHYVAQGKDLETAYGLAKADAYAILSAQISGEASKYGGLRSIESAKMESGKLDERQVKMRSDAFAQAWDQASKKAAIQHAQNEDAYQRQTLAMQIQAKAGADRAGQYETAALAGHAVPAEANALLSPATRGVMAKMPDGSLRAATGIIGKQSVEAASSAFADTMKNLDTLDAIRAKYPNGWQTGLMPGESLQDKAAAEAIYQKMLFGIARMNEPVGILTEKDIERAGRVVPNITDSSIVYDTKVRRLEELRNVLQTRMQSIYDAHLVGGAKVPARIAFSPK